MSYPLQPVTLSSLGLAVLLFGGFVAALFLGSIVLPGAVHTGVCQLDGTCQRYKLNGLLLFVLLTGLVIIGTWGTRFSLLIVYTHFWSLCIVANAFACLLTVLLVYRGRRTQPHAGSAATDGRYQILRELWYGTELNPSWLDVDLKLFSYRPSLLGLGLINAAFAYVQYQLYGCISLRMGLYQLFTLVYLANYFQFEYGMLHTWDIMAERFGWMLIWGDYVVVPFCYSLPGWFLIDQTEALPPLSIVGLIALYLGGFWLFRGANEQKHRYKRDPDARIWGQPATTIGGKLLVSGFWGIGRKLNYTGELCMYYAWTLLCGFDSLVPYALPLWLMAFLMHRARRDEQRCQQKYGALWTLYCRRARFRMLPYLY